MKSLTAKGQETVKELAQKYGISESSVLAMLQAVSLGGGTMAQFNIPELGGGGQWMRGGMTMVGDMFNYSLQNKVSGLCSDLSNSLHSDKIFEPTPESAAGNQNFTAHSIWWPSELGQPSTSGAQNNLRYAYFPTTKRLVVETDGQQTVYDTLHHQVSGVSQQQSGLGYNLQFTSQLGNLDLKTLPVISPLKDKPSSSAPVDETEVKLSIDEIKIDASKEEDIIKTIEKLAGLVKKGIVTEAEFAAKKKELLSRL